MSVRSGNEGQLIRWIELIINGAQFGVNVIGKHHGPTKLSSDEMLKSIPAFRHGDDKWISLRTISPAHVLFNKAPLLLLFGKSSLKLEIRWGFQDLVLPVGLKISALFVVLCYR